VAVSKMELLELVRKAEGGDVDFLREGVRVLAQALMEAEVSAQIGAEHSERTLDRVTHRNGYRLRDWDTRAGTIELAIPRVRQGSYLPSILEPRRRAERALTAVVAQCYVEGVSTRRVDDIARAMGLEGISKSQVSRMCAELDEVVAAWRNRPLDAGP
jgi:putative transposase